MFRYTKMEGGGAVNVTASISHDDDREPRWPRTDKLWRLRHVRMSDRSKSSFTLTFKQVSMATGKI